MPIKKIPITLLLVALTYCQLIASPTTTDTEDTLYYHTDWSGSVSFTGNCPVHADASVTLSSTVGEIIKTRVTVSFNTDAAEDLDYSVSQTPSARLATLCSDNGGLGDDFTNTVFDDDAARAITSILESEAPFTGTFRPEVALTTFNGINADGTWWLSACDDFGGWTTDIIMYFKVEVWTVSSVKIAEGILQKPNRSSLDVFPNPFNSSLRISVGARHAVPLQIEIFDIAGKKVFTAPVGNVRERPDDGRFANRPYEIVWDGTDNFQNPLPNGVYFIKDKISGKQTKAVLMK